jgi:hypothetical protein
MNQNHIRYTLHELYAHRRWLENEIDKVDEDVLKLQAECRHLNRKHRSSCPDCDKEFLEVETEGERDSE